MAEPPCHAVIEWDIDGPCKRCRAYPQAHIKSGDLLFTHPYRAPVLKRCGLSQVHILHDGPEKDHFHCLVCQGGRLHHHTYELPPEGAARASPATGRRNG